MYIYIYIYIYPRLSLVRATDKCIRVGFRVSRLGFRVEA